MIVRQDGYALRKIEDAWYLLPFGQRVADQKRGLLLNETGVVLWNLLEKPTTQEILSKALAAKYEVTAQEYPELAADVNAFVAQLMAHGILRETKKTIKQPLYQVLEIAGFKIGLYGEPEWFPAAWDLFKTDQNKYSNCGNAKTDSVEDYGYGKQMQPSENYLNKDKTEAIGQTESMQCKPDLQIELLPYPFRNRQKGMLLLQNHELNVCQTEDGYVLEFPTMENIKAVELSGDGSSAQIYLLPGETDEYRDNIFHVVRHIFLYFAQKKGLYAIHSASVLYQGCAWLFSGHSGVGKSTHTNLWNRQFQTPLLNGDLNLVGEKDGRLYVYGMPWCGTSGICTKESYPLGGIVLLAQDVKNQIQTLTKTEKTVKVMQRMISPVWTEEMLDRNLDFAGKIAENVPVCSYRCTKEPEAAEYLRNYIDISADKKVIV